MDGVFLEVTDVDKNDWRSHGRHDVVDVKPAQSFPATLTETQASQAHALLSGGGSQLAALVAESRRLAPTQKVEWLTPVTPATVHHLCALRALADEIGASLTLCEPQGLSEREAAILLDYEVNGPAASTKRLDRLWKTLGEFAGALGECWFAVREAMSGKRHRRGAIEPRAVIIGAYGGDHVGDAAILGGVLLHLHETLGVTAVDVLSHRPDHTRRLAAGLTTPVRCEVRPYTPQRVRDRLDGASALVVAGGPLMDLPRVLAKHLGAAYRARALGVPIYVERVGIGPFKGKISQWASRRILLMAQDISLRASGSARHPVMDGLSSTVGRDPAFDYLATRTKLDRLTPAAAQSVETLLAGTEGRSLIGINIRPIYHRWSTAGEDYSRTAEDQFNEELAQGMIRMSAAAGRPVTFVFFPMNPIYFGKSDLAAAWRLHKAVGDKVDLRVWEADPDVDDLLHLLRKMDAVLAMRFHAAIFALSQNLPTLGVDYYPGKGGKVEHLFADLGRTADATRIDLFSADWFAQKLTAMLDAKRGRED